MTHGNGLLTSAGYDLDYCLSSLTLKDGTTNVSALAYAYTDGMNLTGITNTVTAANYNTLSYTPANRLAAASGAWGNATYSYDGAGNIATDVRPGETYAYTYNKRNRLSSVTRNAVAYATYTYNALEQLTSRVTTAAGAPAGKMISTATYNNYKSRDSEISVPNGHCITL